MKQPVILIGSLAEFKIETPPPGVVRLNLTERVGSRKYGSGKSAHFMPILYVHLDLQGLDARGTVVWLHDNVELARTPGNSDFWTPRDRVLYEQMTKMHDLVKDWLEGQGYEVRAGQFGLPESIKPVKGQFECVKWVRQADDSFLVEAATNE